MGFNFGGALSGGLLGGVLGGGAGAAMGAGAGSGLLGNVLGGGQQNATTTTVNDIPEIYRPFVNQYLQDAQSLSGQRYQPFGGQRIAGLTPEHERALQMTTQRAQAGSPVMNAAQQNVASTLRGDYLSPGSNPWLDATYQRGLEQVRGAIAPNFGHMQAFGGHSGYNEALARGAADLATGIYGGNYQQERGRQMQAGLLAPQMAEADYRDSQALLGVGDIRREASQDQLNLAYQNFLEQRQHPYQQNLFMGDALQRAMHGQGTQTTTGPNPYQPNRAANALGGAAIGGSFGGPWGAAGGGLLGLLLS